MLRMSALIVVVFLSGCSANWHLKKAIAKDPSILTEGVVIERVTDTITVYVEPIDTTLTVVVPADTLRGVAPLQKLLTSGLTFQNERQIVHITFNPISEQVSVEAQSKEFHYPARVKIAGRWIKIPHTYDRTTIRPIVRSGAPYWILWLLAAMIMGVVAVILRLPR
jgi:hypothetical protein